MSTEIVDAKRIEVTRFNEMRAQIEQLKAMTGFV